MMEAVILLIVNMEKLNDVQLAQAARLLTDALPQGWPTYDDAMQELCECIIPGNTLLAAMEGDEVIGFGGILAPEYGDRVYELHPLAVRADCRKRGVGRAIVTALEDEARRRGGITIQLGADDEREGGETSLANVDLYDNLPERLKNFQPGTHQAGFYLKMGYSIIGVMPDANGIGKPDIFFGKRL